MPFYLAPYRKLIYYYLWMCDTQKHKAIVREHICSYSWHNQSLCFQHTHITIFGYVSRSTLEQNAVETNDDDDDDDVVGNQRRYR